MCRWLLLLAMWSLFWPLSSSGTGETARSALSQTTTTGEGASATEQHRATFLANMMAPPPNIALKVQPARTLRFSKSQLNSLLADLRHEVKSQVAILEGEMAEEERRRQKTASTWAVHGSPIWIPKEARGASAGTLAAGMSFLSLHSHLAHSDGPREKEEYAVRLQKPFRSADAVAAHVSAVTGNSSDEEPYARACMSLWGCKVAFEAVESL